MAFAHQTSTIDSTINTSVGTPLNTGGATTTIEFRYTTTNAPSSGVIAFDIFYFPINGGSLA